MHESMNKFANAFGNFGLTIGAQNTHYAQASHTWNSEWSEASVVDKFMYLGSTLSRSDNINDEVNNRIAKASSAFGRLTDEERSALKPS